MTQGVARLKELLFDDESETLSDLGQRLEHALARVQTLEGTSRQATAEHKALTERVDRIFDTAGTRERLSSSVAATLDEALRQADVNNHKDVSEAMAPFVVQTIRYELRNSQDELVDVLYPITGRMVRSYVATAMKDLVRDLGRRVERNGMMLRIRSLFSGKSVAELAIVESQHLKVEEIFLIKRGSGQLVARWPAGRQLSNSDIHMSGVLSAINDFASQTFQSDGGNLRTFELDDFTVYLRASPVYLVAAKCRGLAPSGVAAIFDEEFLNLLDRVSVKDTTENTGAETEISARNLAPLAGDVEQKTAAIYARNERAGLAFSPLKALFFIIAIPIFAGLLWWGYTWLEWSRTVTQAKSVLASIPELEGYPVNLDVGFRGRDVRVSGLAPNKAIRSRLQTKLAAALPASQVNAKLAIIPHQNAVDQSRLLANLKSEISAAEIEARRQGVQKALERTNQRLAEAKLEFDRIEARLKSEAQRGRLQSIRSEMARLTRQLGTYTTLARANGRDLAALQNLNKPLYSSSLSIGKTATDVASLVDQSVKPVPPSHQASPPSDVGATAEYLEAQAQRLATTAIAVSQALLVRPAEQVSAQVLAKITDLERLEEFVERNAIFFANGTDYRDPAAADAIIDRLVKIFTKTDVTIRVAGYTDETGNSDRNNPLAQSRADKVVEELVARGVARDRIVAVGRANAVNLSNVTGPESANRRVQFEIALTGEVGGN